MHYICIYIATIIFNHYSIDVCLALMTKLTVQVIIIITLEITKPLQNTQSARYKSQVGK